MGTPRWLRATADALPARPAPSGASEQTIRSETCTVESLDGIAVLRCEEVLERFRLAADGHREMVESSSSTTIRPYGAAPEGLRASSSGRYDDAAAAAMAPVISATLGQMLDDFFAYAHDLQDSLEQRGVHADGDAGGWRLSGARGGGADGGSGGADGGGSGGSSSGLFGWWQRRKGGAAGAPSVGSPGGQPSLQQLASAPEPGSTPRGH
ncbi:hypothetical protein HT031_005039 [Scenedesmus sp. PABB004]|nr:hypothetical protein HT031_005039 [Scenedesmus sp. PABB004]